MREIPSGWAKTLPSMRNEPSPLLRSDAVLPFSAVRFGLVPSGPGEARGRLRLGRLVVDLDSFFLPLGFLDVVPAGADLAEPRPADDRGNVPRASLYEPQSLKLNTQTSAFQATGKSRTRIT
jgi:hypothetical protein